MSATLPSAPAEIAGRWTAYPAYRDSGIEWARDIPAHWEVRQLKFLAEVRTGLAKGRDLGMAETIELPYLRVANVQDGYLDLSTMATMPISAKELDNYALKPGDVLMNEGGDNDKLGRGCVWEGRISPCLHQNHVFAVRPTKDVESAWIAAITLAPYAKHYFMINSKQSTNLASISSTNLKELPVVIPPSHERAVIFNYIKNQTARIDILVAAKERLIELLHEKRAALISQAVTRGLDPVVALTDSGVEWLGRMPAHWRVKQVKRCVRAIEQGWSPLCENRPADPDEWGVLKVGCVNGAAFDPDENKALPKGVEPLEEYEIHPGDVLISRANTRELLGSASLVGKVRSRLLLCDKLYRLRIPPTSIEPAYVVHALGSNIARFQFEREATGASASMQNISQATVRNLVLPLPPLAEQQQIAAFLDRETAKIDALIAKVHQHIALLREYRTALISAAVTGKIDVRQEAP